MSAGAFLTVAGAFALLALAALMGAAAAASVMLAAALLLLAVAGVAALVAHWCDELGVLRLYVSRWMPGLRARAMTTTSDGRLMPADQADAYEAALLNGRDEQDWSETA